MSLQRSSSDSESGHNTSLLSPMLVNIPHCTQRDCIMSFGIKHSWNTALRWFQYIFKQIKHLINSELECFKTFLAIMRPSIFFKVHIVL
jgi:hypothetical protein